jgi:hypothetical protein
MPIGTIIVDQGWRPRSRTPASHKCRLKMSRAPASFRQSDLARAIKAYVKAGIPAERIRTAFDKNGRPVIFVAKPDDADRCNAWDDAVAALEAQ